MTLTREEAIKQIIVEKVYIEDIPGSDKTVEALEMAIEALEEEPRIKAEWIDLGAVFECSACHERSCCPGNYCPDCGADMRDEEEEE